MKFNTKEQNKEFEDALMELAVLGLLEIEGQKLLAESERLNSTQSDQMPASKIRVLERRLWLQRQADRLTHFKKAAQPVFRRVAVIFLTICLGVGTVLAVSADARDVLYQLLFSQYKKYAEIVVNPHSDSADYEAYKQAGAAFVPTYVPDDVCLLEIENTKYSIKAKYGNQNENALYLSFEQMKIDNTLDRIDTENSDNIESIVIGESEGLLIIKREITQIVWSIGDTCLTVITNLPSNNAIKFAQGIENL